jgi:hypothetical protein
MLLLGTGDSGKSTFSKQVRLIFKGGFNEGEISAFIDGLLSKTVHNINAIINATKTLSISVDPELMDSIELLLAEKKTYT